MLRFGETKVAKEKLCSVKEARKIWYVDVNNIAISKLFETKSSSRYLIGCLDKFIRCLVLILPKMSVYVKTIKVNNGDKDENNKLISFHIYDDKLLVKCKTI